MKTTVILVILMALSGCMSITTNLTPVRQDIKASVMGSDCVPIILGFGLGTSTVEQARANGRKPSEGWTVDAPLRQIRVVRSTALYELNVLVFGMRCLEIEGEE